MTLIVETGTASATSEAYASVDYADILHDAIGNTLWATLILVEKEQALRRAASFMCQAYRMRWKGSRVNFSQALDWPRYNVDVSDLGVYTVVYPDNVPDIVQRANAELALLAAAGDLNPTRNQGILSKAVGPIKIVYDSASPLGKRYPAIEAMLEPFFGAVSSGLNAKLRRV